MTFYLNQARNYHNTWTSKLYEDGVWNVTTIPGLSNHPSEERPILNDFENLYFRLETQISTPLDESSSLFLVKVDVIPLKNVWDEVILESINSMSEDVLNYKNLSEIKKFLNSWSFLFPNKKKN